MNEAPTELKRIKIAEACGWKWFPSPYNSEQRVLARSEQEAETVLVGHMACHLAPDYFNDLNACREMEESLGLDQSTAYVNMLWPQGYSAFQAVHAAAAHRAEAFGKTLNLW